MTQTVDYSKHTARIKKDVESSVEKDADIIRKNLARSRKEGPYRNKNDERERVKAVKHARRTLRNEERFLGKRSRKSNRKRISK